MMIKDLLKDLSLRITEDEFCAIIALGIDYLIHRDEKEPSKALPFVRKVEIDIPEVLRDGATLLLLCGYDFVAADVNNKGFIRLSEPLENNAGTLMDELLDHSLNVDEVIGRGKEFLTKHIRYRPLKNVRPIKEFFHTN